MKERFDEERLPDASAPVDRNELSLRRVAVFLNEGLFPLASNDAYVVFCHVL